MSKKSIGIIPARFASTRFPGKPLVDIAGKTMIQRVYEQACQSNLDKVIVATDEEAIMEAVLKIGGEAVYTGLHSNGTSRCIEAFLNQAIDYDILVNIQGDEPFIRPEQINAVLTAFELEDSQIATLAKRLEKLEDILNPNTVKVVLSQAISSGLYNALYFSRSPIPYIRDFPQEQWLTQQIFYKHLGLYAFSRNFICQHYPKLKASSLEQAESLEQLCWLENNHTIRILETTFETPNIDSPEDVKKALDWLKNQK